MRNLAKDEIEMAAKRETMLDEGFRLFAESGIEPVSMLEIAKASGIGVATLYRYYNTKLALVLAIGTREWEKYSAKAKALREENRADEMTAAGELSFYLDFYIDLYKNHKDLLKYNQNFNNYVQHEGATPEQLRPYLDAISNIGDMFYDLYEKGKRDGTIKTDMPADKAFAATSHIMLAVAVRYAQGLLYAENEENQTDEIALVKHMILQQFVIEG
jgi:AcrR family transcriptional regulator